MYQGVSEGDGGTGFDSITVSLMTNQHSDLSWCK